MPSEVDAKTRLRARLRAARRARQAQERARDATRLAAVVLALPEVTGLAAGSWVAGYVSVGAELQTSELLDSLVGAGLGVLLPVLLPDLDLDWAAYAGAARLVPSSVPGRSRLLEPSGPRLGVNAVAGAGLVLVPALAISRTGLRLGQGGGSYDRALGRVSLTVPTVGVLYDGELLPDVPGEPHDRRVTMAVLPSGVVRF
jgi:5-formyltetrahydrofolate cyclo-ligase